MKILPKHTFFSPLKIINMKKILIFLLCLYASALHAQTLVQDVVGHRGLLDMSSIFSYDMPKIRHFEGFKLAELSVGEINLEGKIINSQLVYVNLDELANLKSLAKVIFADYLSVKVVDGRFVQATDAEVKDGIGIRLVFNYGQQFPVPPKNFSITGINDKRTLGVFDLEFIIFYKMKFVKPGSDFDLYQTAMTKYDSTLKTRITRSKLLVAFLNQTDVDKIKKTEINASIIESVESVWSKEKDKWVILSETTWDKKNTEKYKVNLAWSADINTTIQKQKSDLDKSAPSTTKGDQKKSEGLRLWSDEAKETSVFVHWNEEEINAVTYVLTVKDVNGEVVMTRTMPANMPVKGSATLSPLKPMASYTIDCVATMSNGSVLRSNTVTITTHKK